MQNNGKVGGILSIVAGGIGALGALTFVFLAIMMWIFSDPVYYYDGSTPDGVFMIMLAVYGIIAFIMVLIAALAIIGGVFGIRRKNWGLALAGSIAAAMSFFPCGIPAIIFTALGKPEFAVAPKPASTAVQT